MRRKPGKNSADAKQGEPQEEGATGTHRGDRSRGKRTRMRILDPTGRRFSSDRQNPTDGNIFKGHPEKHKMEVTNVGSHVGLSPRRYKESMGS